MCASAGWCVSNTVCMTGACVCLCVWGGRGVRDLPAIIQLFTVCTLCFLPIIFSPLFPLCPPTHPNHTFFTHTHTVQVTMEIGDGGRVWALFYENAEKTDSDSSPSHLSLLSTMFSCLHCSVCTTWSQQVAMFDIITESPSAHPSCALSPYLILRLLEIKIDAVRQLMKSTWGWPWLTVYSGWWHNVLYIHHINECSTIAPTLPLCSSFLPSRWQFYASEARWLVHILLIIQSFRFEIKQIFRQIDTSGGCLGKFREVFVNL